MKFPLEHGYLTYERVGSGIPLLFIHGYPLSRKIWQPQLAGLSDIASIISVDLRGHGKSYPFDPPYTVELLAEDCKQLLDYENVTEPVVVCGLSMGGYVAFALYRNYPQLFRGMILTSTRAGPDSPEGKVNRDTSIKNVRDHGVGSIAESMLAKMVSPVSLTSKPDLVESIRAIMLETSQNGVIGALQAMRDRPDSSPLLAQINFPVLILHGADDQLIPPSEANSMHQNIIGSRFAIVPEAGHLPNLEQPDEFNHAVREFVSAVG